MPDYGTNKKSISKEIQYLGRDFTSLRQNLIEFAKSYFPNTYNDFNEASPGMMFIEMAAYVGDVLNYYVDNQFRESLLHAAEEKKNIFKIAQSYGYVPKLSHPATAVCDFSVKVPATTDDDISYRPNLNYAPILNANSIVSSPNGTEFRLMDDINFAASSSLDVMNVEISDFSDNIPTYYTLTKKGIVESGKKTVEEITFGAAEKFNSLVLGNTNVVDVYSVTDSDNNKWYEVPFLAQDTVFESVPNTSDNDPELASTSTDTPYLLKLIKSSRRFTKYVRSDGKTELRFGAGVSDNPDEEIIPNPDNVGSSLATGLNKLDTSYDPSNFLKTRTFGLAPSNTVLTVNYTYGGSTEDNVLSNEIINKREISWTLDETNLTDTEVVNTKQSLIVTNKEPASGGSGGETDQEIKENALAYFNTQNRAVTKEDYITRVYSLPQKFGNVAKAYIVQDEALSKEQTISENGVASTIVNKVPNPLAMNLYMLGYDRSKNLVRLNKSVKENIKTYLSQYRLMTDAINIRDGYMINIGVKFAIITQRGFNKQEVLFKCVEEVKKHFEIEKWQFNQPIILSDIAYKISLVDGVASVVPPKGDNPEKSLVLVENKWRYSEGYSGYVYDIKSATQDGIIYPSLDPSIFEIKYPNTDIQGRVVGDI
jgi:hypothetical protein|tara:strand:+ start:1793 stop:3748 length:1956 start_codon:yes stop_codon:yes gene_type:complete